MKSLVLILLTLFSAGSFADVYPDFQGGIGQQIKVESLRFVDGYVHVRFDPKLSKCNGGEHYRMHARVSTDRAALVSTLLAAYTAGMTFQYVWFTSSDLTLICSYSHVLELTQVEFTDK